MLDPQEIAKLEELQRRVDCSKKWACLFAEIETLSDGKHSADRLLMECFSCNKMPCAYLEEAAGVKLCGCPLRKYIAENFDRWSAGSTAHLRAAIQSPEQPKKG